MESILGYRLRKCSDVEMENAYFEVLDENDVAFMDVSRSHEGEIRVLFYPGISSKWMPIELLKRLLSDAEQSLD